MRSTLITKVYLSILAALLLSLVFSACKNAGIAVTTTQPVTTIPAEITKPSSISLSIPAESTDPVFQNLNNPRATQQFYTLVKNNAIWFDGNILTSRADSLRSFLKDVRYYGLLRNNYHYDTIENTISQPEAALRCEILLTDAFLSLAKELKYGRRPAKNQQRIDSAAIYTLQKAIEQGSIKRTLREQEPAFTGYRSLKLALQLAIDTLDRKIKHLLLAGSIHDSISTQKEIRLIEINLERWRRESLPYAGRYISINIPAFSLWAFDNESVVLESRVIVGTPDKQTPELSSLIECVSIYPYWHVPRKIVIEEYLHVIQKDSTFLTRNNFDVLDRQGKVLRRDSIDWKKFNANYFPVSLRQREGTENSLGVIKFIFDNPYAVYLHDTNAKRLFKNKIRAYSHGCIRIEKAEALAHYLVTGSVNKKSKTVEKYLLQKKQHLISLEQPIPIYIRYYTCDYSHGRFFIYNDLYGKDRAIINLLYGNTLKPAVIN